MIKLTLEILGISVLWIFLFFYIIVASIDFGAGFFSAYSEWSGRKQLIHPVIQRYLSPVWEVTNVFLIFFFVGIVGFFPKTAYYYGTALLIPGSISIILLAIRGSYYAFSTYGVRDNKWHTFLYGVTGVLIPASFTTVLTISEGGFISIENGELSLLYEKLLVSPYSWSVVLLSISSVLFISAGFLTWYANSAGDTKAVNLLRKYMITWSFPTILAGIVVLFSLQSHNPLHFKSLTDLSWMFVLSFSAFLWAVWLVYRKKYFWAFTLVVVQYLLAFLGYGISHYPYLLYPHLTLFDGFTNQTTAIALIVAFIFGLLLLIPSLYLLMKLFLFNRPYVQGKR